LKNFITKYVIKPKNEREKFSPSEIVTLIGIITIPINITLLFGMTHIMHEYREMKNENTVERCRIRGIIINDDYSKTYLCKSIYDNTKILINENESDNIDNNPYLYRPVRIYKNGDVE
jgi:hypothetical protein